MATALPLMVTTSAFVIATMVDAGTAIDPPGTCRRPFPGLVDDQLVSGAQMGEDEAHLGRHARALRFWRLADLVNRRRVA